MIEINNEFNLGDIVNASRYDITNGIIVGIESHFNDNYNTIYTYDYDVLYVDNTGERILDHLSEDHLELV